ncbi:MAG: DEAD/DEAH box helicase family protein [Hyphomicrobiaceae bacterium]|nr:DEAD/DEAH box helicase family protein [Hyphomicrobiaceae bacterium]
MSDLFSPSIDVELPALEAMSGRHGGAVFTNIDRPKETVTLALDAKTVRGLSYILGTTPDGRSFAFVDRNTAAQLDVEQVFRVSDASTIDGFINSLKQSPIERVLPKPDRPASTPVEDDDQRTMQIAATWPASFQLNREITQDDIVVSAGLRSPQIGAVYAALAHWTVSSHQATIVMPTGTGKTETMLALVAAVPIHRLLIVVPNDALRTQISEKFAHLGVLKICGCLARDAKHPVVANLKSIPKTLEEVDDVFRRANVIVTTMNVAGRAEPAIQQRMAELVTHLFIDEAHHIGAKTWRGFRSQFGHVKVMQFTATPFRRDKGRVDGRHIYVYPLRKAQEENYFRQIEYLPVNGIDQADADNKIIEKVGEIIARDRDAGFDHVVMARCEDKNRANALHARYAARYPEHNPIILHSDMPYAKKHAAIAELRARKSRIIVCVNMLGEGFDLPDLKIAALHDKQKSEAVTLQFVGRFTRARADLGDATVIANVALGDVNESLRKLYAEDADWDRLLNKIGTMRTEREVRREDVFRGFTEEPERFPLETLYPRMSTVVYRTGNAVWNPDDIEKAFRGDTIVEGPHINEHERLAIFINRDTEQPKWTTVRAVQNVQFNLYMVHWDEEQSLLFIHSSKLNELHEGLAKRICGRDVERITGEQVFRSLHGYRRLLLNNLGLSETQRKPVRYSQFMGSDITPQIDDLPGNRNRAKTNLFGQGYTDEGKTTVGCSRKGKFWSYDATNNFGEWIDWCQALGRKLLNNSIPTDAFLRNLIKPRRLTARPDKAPVAVLWPEGILDLSEDRVDLEINDDVVPAHDCELVLDSHSARGPLKFSIRTPDVTVGYTMTVDENGAHYKQGTGHTVNVRIGRSTKPVTDWFRQDPPHIYFADGDMLVDCELFELPEYGDRPSFDPDRIVPRDWAGINIRKESQGADKDRTSIQRAMIEQLMQDGGYDVIYDDDGSGEAADIIAMRLAGETLHVHLVHCKYSAADTPGGRIDDLYDVCGQAQKSIRWRETPRIFFEHMRKREGTRTRQGKPTRYELGEPATVNGWLARWNELSYSFEITCVQPGYAKSKAADEHLELLAATSYLLRDTWNIPFRLVCSP